MLKGFFLLSLSSLTLSYCTAKQDSSNQGSHTNSATGSGSSLMQSCQDQSLDSDWNIMTKCDTTANTAPITCTIQSLSSSGANECVARSSLRALVSAKKATCLSYKDVVCKPSSSLTSTQSCATNDPGWNAMANCTPTIDGAPVTCSIQDFAATHVNECIARTVLQSQVLSLKSNCLPPYKDIVCIRNNNQFCASKPTDSDWNIATKCSTVADSSPTTCTILNFESTAANECLARTTLRSTVLEKQAGCLSYKDVVCMQGPK